MDQIDCDREIVDIALSYIYPVLPRINKRNYYKKIELVALAALYLVVKLYDPIKIDPSSFLLFSQGHFTIHHLKETEAAIFKTLDWYLHPHTPWGFVQHLMILYVPSSDSDSYLSTKDQIT